MTGLIWTIQLVHYPFFHRLEKENFNEHMDEHRKKISFIVLPVMLRARYVGRTRVYGVCLTECIYYRSPYADTYLVFNCITAGTFTQQTSLRLQ